MADLTADRARRAPGPDPDLLERDAAAIARAESLDTGKRLVESEYDIADVVSVFRFYADAARALQPSGESVDTGREGIESRVVKEPVGVCALITPWNYPLLQASWKITPCLAAGATFVLKPSEITPHSTIHLMRLLDEAGLPTGVGNLVLGTGPGCGGPLSTDPRVDLHRPHRRHRGRGGAAAQRPRRRCDRCRARRDRHRWPRPGGHRRRDRGRRAGPGGGRHGIRPRPPRKRRSRHRRLPGGRAARLCPGAPRGGRGPDRHRRGRHGHPHR
ncbi:MAG: aldehyde dehydrogenase family protein [Dermatophilaceae bacterium]